MLEDDADKEIEQGESSLISWKSETSKCHSVTTEETRRIEPKRQLFRRVFLPFLYP